MNKYFIKFGLSNKPNAGSKAMRDIMDLLCNQGYKCVVSLPTNANKLFKLLDIPILIFTILFKIRKNGVLIYFVPSNLQRIKLLAFFKRIIKYRLICFINDVESLRVPKNNECTQREINGIKVADIILVPNNNSKDILSTEFHFKNHMIPVHVWDYLYDKCPTPKIATHYQDLPIALAGNFHFFPYLKELNKITCNFKIWGEKTVYIQQENLIFMGTQTPEGLINDIIDCSWGLVWYGESIESCTGELSNYIKFCNSHKCGLYLAAGIPLIVWKESGMAHFVNENKVGICVESLYEAESIIKGMNDEDYNKYRDNARRIGENIRHGHYFLEALKKAESIYL